MSNTPFEKFFHGQFQTMLEAVGDVPGLMTEDFPLSQSSWDRKAAYLLWLAMGNTVGEIVAPLQIQPESVPELEQDAEDLLG